MASHDTAHRRPSLGIVAAVSLVAWMLPPAVRAGGHPDFTGTWKIDLAASDPSDELMRVMGRPWPERKAVKAMPVTQRIQQGPDTLVVSVESPVKRRMETLKLDGSTEVKDTEIAGMARISTAWSEGGQSLVTVMEVKLRDGTPAKLSITRSLADGGRTMIQRMEIETEDGRSYAANRVFRRATEAPGGGG